MWSTWSTWSTWTINPEVACLILVGQLLGHPGPALFWVKKPKRRCLDVSPRKEGWEDTLDTSNRRTEKTADDAPWLRKSSPESPCFRNRCRKMVETECLELRNCTIARRTFVSSQRVGQGDLRGCRKTRKKKQCDLLHLITSNCLDFAILGVRKRQFCWQVFQYFLKWSEELWEVRAEIEKEKLRILAIWKAAEGRTLKCHQEVEGFFLVFPRMISMIPKRLFPSQKYLKYHSPWRF